MDRRKLLLRAVVSVALLVLVGWNVDWPALLGTLRKVDPVRLMIASAATLPLIVALAVRWRIFLVSQAIPISFPTLFSLTWAGQFFNSVLPGSTGGDVVKIVQLCRLAPQQKAAAAATVLADRLVALVALLALAGLGGVLAPGPWRLLAQRDELKMLGWWGGLAVLLAGAAGVWAAARRRRTSPWLGRAQRTLTAARSVLQSKASLAAAGALSVGIHLWSFLIVFLFARALGLEMTYSQVLLMMPVLLLLVMLPITVNGHGLREVLLIFYFTQWRLALPGEGVRETVVAFSLLLVANDLLWSLPGGLWYLARFAPGGDEVALAATDSPVK